MKLQINISLAISVAFVGWLFFNTVTVSRTESSNQSLRLSIENISYELEQKKAKLSPVYEMVEFKIGDVASVPMIFRKDNGMTWLYRANGKFEPVMYNYSGTDGLSGMQALETYISHNEETK